ncbi:MAG: cyclic nucleotide-binding domain-containing protein [Byssovorax sp.]
MALRASAHGVTDVGRRRRRNEDAFLIDEAIGLFAVADGMGGHSGGDVASKHALAVVQAELAARSDLLQAFAADPSAEHRKNAQLLVEHAVQKACAGLLALARQRPELSGMGSTFVGAVIAGDRAIVAHVGDSRLYLARKGSAHALTEDHSLIAAQIKSGQMARENAANSPFKGVLTRALGQQESVQVDTLVVDLLPGDRLVLCSDGLHNHLGDEETPALFLGSTPELLPGELVALANARGGQDNITALVVAFEGASEEDPAALSRIDALQRIPLFAYLVYREISEVLAIGQTLRFSPGERIVHEGDPGGDLFVVLQGRVAVEAGGVTMATLEPGGHFGEMGLVDAAPRSASVLAVEPTKVLLIPRAEMMGLMHREPVVGVKLLWVLAQSLSQRLRTANLGWSEAVAASAEEHAPFSRA